MERIIATKITILLALLVSFSAFTTSVAYAQQSTDNFEVSQRLVQVKMKVGEVIDKEVRIFNKAPNEIALIVQIYVLNGTVTLDKQVYTIGPQKEEATKISFSADAEGVYTGKIVFLDEKQPQGSPKATTLLINEIESENSSMAAKVEVPAEFRTAEAGKDIPIRLSVISLKEQEAKKVSIRYQIMDFDGNIVFKEDEPMSFENSLTLLRKFPVPSSLAKGEYVIGVLVNDGSSTVTSSRIFSVGTSTSSVIALISDNILYLLLGLIIAVVLVLYLNYGRLMSMEKRRVQKVIKIRETIVKVEGSSPKIEEAKYKLRKQMDGLDKAHKFGYISKETYTKTKKMIELALKEADRKLKSG